MTLSSNVSRAEYNGDGATTVFSTIFQFFANDDVEVYLRDAAGAETLWTEGTQYTLTGALTGAAGNVTISTSPTDYTPATGEILVILRAPDEVQETDFPLGGPFPSTAAEQAIDRVVMLIQALREELNRIPKLSVTSPATGVIIPDPENGTVLGWESGQLINFTPNTDAFIGLPASSTNGAIVTWNGASGNALADSGIVPGTAAAQDVGQAAGNVLQLDANANAYASKIIGEPFVIFDHLTGVAPPDNSGTMKFVKLTAGLDGVGQYNEGLLENESVTGSAPLVVATAEISVGPRAGQTIPLLNTEGRYIKPGTSSGTGANDQMQQATGSIPMATATGGLLTAADGVFAHDGSGSSANQRYIVTSGPTTLDDYLMFDNANSPDARTGQSTDVKHVQGTAYMRIV